MANVNVDTNIRLLREYAQWIGDDDLVQRIKCAETQPHNRINLKFFDSKENFARAKKFQLLGDAVKVQKIGVTEAWIDETPVSHYEISFDLERPELQESLIKAIDEVKKQELKGIYPTILDTIKKIAELNLTPDQKTALGDWIAEQIGVANNRQSNKTGAVERVLSRRGSQFQGVAE